MHCTRRQFFYQIVLFLFVVALVLVLFGQVETSDILSAIGVSSLTASCFIVFCLPSSRVSRAWRVLLAYVVALIAGALCSKLQLHFDAHFPLWTTVHWQQCFAVLSVAITALLLLLLRIPHPPAAGLSLGLVLDHWDYPTVIAILCSITLIAIIKRGLDHRLKNLI